jgi:para-nitrobenzyl esterase
MLEVVNTRCGKISGVSVDNGRCVAFKGLPFAAPPIGANRWRVPQPLQPWSGTLHADRYGNAPLQPLNAADHLLAQLGFAAVPECGISEHCLYLNVWTPAHSTTDKLPVIVWICGGGFRVGSGSHPVSEGESFSRQGCVLVTVNYRLSGLGFLAHPALSAESGSSGNYALHDVLAALHWAQENISAFGGDPNCVTLFGQSAGAALVNALMGCDAASGLVHRCIVHSGGRMQGGPMAGFRPRAAAEADGERWLQTLGARTVGEMRRLAGDTLYGAPRQFAPILDGALVTEQPQQSFARGAQLQIPLLCGFTSNEAASFPGLEWQTQAGFEKFVCQSFGATAPQLLKLYAVNNDDSALRASYQLRADISFAYQPWQLAHSHHASSPAPTWLFQFGRAVPLPAMLHYHDEPAHGWGAYHGAELWYVFNTLDRQSSWNWTAADRALADSMCAYWANFARSGNPNAASLPDWPRFDSAAPRAMLLGSNGADVACCEAGAVSNQARLTLIRNHYSAGSSPA